MSNTEEYNKYKLERDTYDLAVNKYELERKEYKESNKNREYIKKKSLE
jgi:hypothetical protein